MSGWRQYKRPRPRTLDNLNNGIDDISSMHTENISLEVHLDPVKTIWPTDLSYGNRKIDLSSSIHSGDLISNNDHGSNQYVNDMQHFVSCPKSRQACSDITRKQDNNAGEINNKCLNLSDTSSKLLPQHSGAKEEDDLGPQLNLSETLTNSNNNYNQYDIASISNSQIQLTGHCSTNDLYKNLTLSNVNCQECDEVTEKILSSSPKSSAIILASSDCAPRESEPESTFGEQLCDIYTSIRSPIAMKQNGSSLAHAEHSNMLLKNQPARNSQYKINELRTELPSIYPHSKVEDQNECSILHKHLAFRQQMRHVFNSMDDLLDQHLTIFRQYILPNNIVSSKFINTNQIDLLEGHSSIENDIKLLENCSQSVWKQLANLRAECVRLHQTDLQQREEKLKQIPRQIRLHRNVSGLPQLTPTNVCHAAADGNSVYQISAGSQINMKKTDIKFNQRCSKIYVTEGIRETNFGLKRGNLQTELVSVDGKIDCQLDSKIIPVTTDSNDTEWIGTIQRACNNNAHKDASKVRYSKIHPIDAEDTSGKLPEKADLDPGEVHTLPFHYTKTLEYDKTQGIQENIFEAFDKRMYELRLSLNQSMKNAPTNPNAKQLEWETISRVLEP